MAQQDAFSLPNREQQQFLETQGYVVTIRSEKRSDGRTVVQETGQEVCVAGIGAVNPFRDVQMHDLVVDTGYRTPEQWRVGLSNLYGVIPERAEVYLLEHP